MDTLDATHNQTSIKRSTSRSSIPLISYLDLMRRDSSAEQALGDALRDVGFFALVDHDIGMEKIQQAYDQVKLLLSLPLEAKMACARPELGGQVGFTRFLQEVAKGAKHPDLKEYWHVMRPCADHDTIPENLWPENYAVDGVRTFSKGQCQEVLLDFFAALDAVSRTVLGTISVYIGEERSFLPEMVDGGYSVLRLLHYPRMSTETFPGSIRAAAHEDINFITLLVNATAPGLELLQRNGQWLPVVAPKGSIIIDSADMLANLTNGLLKATTHRVVNTFASKEPRYSMPFFVHPRQEVSLKPRAASVRMHPGPYGRDISAAAFLRERLVEIGVLKP